jgi:hypothetical protein
MVGPLHTEEAEAKPSEEPVGVKDAQATDLFKSNFEAREAANAKVTAATNKIFLESPDAEKMLSITYKGVEGHRWRFAAYRHLRNAFLSKWMDLYMSELDLTAYIEKYRLIFEELYCNAPAKNGYIYLRKYNAVYGL